jgi:hypothetical protein
MPRSPSLAGAWVGNRYYLLAVESGEARLWPVSSADGELGAPVSLSPHGGFPDCQSVPYDAVALGGKIVIYGQFGLKSDGTCALPGGFVIVDPVTGAVSERFASRRGFRQLVAGAGGQYLYGLEAGGWRQVRIVKLDAATGRVLAEKPLEPDVWYLTTGRLPSPMEGRLDLVATVPPDRD